MKPSIFLTILFMAVLLWSCSNIKENQTVNLESAWKFRKAGDAEWLPAKVPGCVHTDLIDHQKIADPFFRKNELDVNWIETTDWEYETTFTLSNEIAAASNINVQFDGLDTYADVYLNDSLVLEADNMFIAWTVQAKKYLKPGENKLRIYFHSAVNVGMEKLKKVPYLIMAANEIAPENERSNVFTRKAPFHYGWDWGPRLVTCGVWKPVKIVAWNELIMKDLYLKPVDVSVEKATYKAIAEITTEKESKLNLEVWVDNAKIAAKETQVIAGTNPVELDFAIDKPELWWTNGLGGHKLYNIQLRVVHGRKTVQTLADRIGVRTIELVRDKDSLGNNFYFHRPAAGLAARAAVGALLHLVAQRPGMQQQCLAHLRVVPERRPGVQARFQVGRRQPAAGAAFCAAPHRPGRGLDGPAQGAGRHPHQWRCDRPGVDADTLHARGRYRAPAALF